MTFNRVCPPCLFLCLAALASSANAQNTATPASGGYSTDATGFASAGDFSGSYLFGNDGGTYFLFDKMVGDGPGYSSGYSRLGLRVKLHDAGDSHLWGSAYALITDENRVGVNFGGGYRWLFDSNILTLHGWWDSYETDFGNRYDQVTAGIELLHEDLDMRVNGYMPIGDTENIVGVTNPGTVTTFTSRGIGFFGQVLDEEALKGIDAEVGTGIFGVNWARIYGGGYWYEGRNTNFGGARGRIETAISPDLSLNFIVQNDTEFNTNYQMSVEYRFSGGLAPGFFTPFHGESRKYNPVKRQWPVATQVVEIDAIIPMLNPKTGDIMTASFVDNTNANAGDGSLENPYRELPSSDDADKIFVFSGIGATMGNITLMDNQQLLGQGKLFTFQDPERGTVTAPAEFATGDRPLLTATNPAQNVITLANWNRVANFGILGPATAAIGGANISDFEIDMVTGGNVTDGIRIVNASGNGIIRNSGFAAADEGIFVSNVSGAPLHLTIEGTSMSDPPNALDGLTSLGGNDGIHVRANGADIHLVMNDVAVDNSTNRGITLDAAFGARLTANIDNAIAYNTGNVSGDGFNLNVVEGASMAVQMTDVGARGNGDLLVVDARDSSFVGTINGSDFSDSVTGSGVRMNLENATGRLSFDDLTANRNAINGIEALATGSGTDFLLSVVDSQLSANFGSGMSVDIMDGADFRHFVDPTFVTLSGGSGLEYSVQGAGSVYIADIISTDFSESTLHAIDGYVFDGASANVDLTNTPGVLAGLNGYNLVVDQNASFIGTVNHAQFNGAADSAIDVSATNNSSLSLTMANITGQANGDYGLRYLAGGGSELFLAITNADFNNNPDSNIDGTSSGAGSRASVYLTNVTADAAAADGSVVLNADSGGINNLTWNTGSISQGDADGVVARVDGPGSQIRMNFSNLIIGTNSFDGIDGMLTNGGAGSLLNLSLVNSSVTQNGINGIDLSISGPGALSQVTINNTPVGGNFSGDGFEFDVMNGAALLASAFGPASHFSQNGERSWDGSVDGAGSIANLNFNGTHAVQNGLEGGLFEITNGGHMNLTLSNLAISENLLDGLLTTVDGANSRAHLNLDQVEIRRNGLSLVGDGFEAIATNGGAVTALLTNMNVVQNREDGFRFDASNGSTIDMQMNNVIANLNGRHGLEYHANSGSGFSGVVTSSSFSNNGTVFVGNGVWGTADGAGSGATGVFQGVLADNNSRMGFEFDVRNGATLLGDIRSNTQFGSSSGSGNAVNGVRFNAQNAGTMGFLKMMGPNTFDDNVAGDGVNYDAVGVAMAVANVTGSANNNGGDGINIRMINVGSGSIALSGEGTGSIIGNAGDGIDITTQNVTLTDKTINGMLIPDFQIDGFTITGNGGDPIVVNMTNTTFNDGEITNNVIDGGTDAINVHLGAGDGDLLIDGNIISGAMQYGIAVTSDAGTHKVTITNNQVTTSGDTNIIVDLFGTTETGLMINDNILVGGGSPTATLNTGLNFTSLTALTSPSPGITPPDTMGGVSHDHIVHILNNGYAVFDKTTGTQLFSSSLEQFWIDAGLPPLDPGEIVTDPRIIFDPTVDRWFVVSIDADPSAVGSASNNILLAVSNTDNPLDGFVGLEFVADTTDGIRLGDYPTLGVDADGIYIGVNNFDSPISFADVALYSIPKVDLLAAVPTLANMTRFEVEDAMTRGFTLQAAVDFGPSDGVTHVIGTNVNTFLNPAFIANNLIRSDILGSGGAGAMLSAPTNVTVNPYQAPPPGDQPLGGFQLDNVAPRFSGNVVVANGSLWAAHAITGNTGNSAIRWYEIDPNTNTVLQSNIIEDPALDFMEPSIAVNQQGIVVIGFTGTGPAQPASAMAVLGVTSGLGVTTFQTPFVTQAGSGSYATGFPTSRWGDYSATVVDPDDPNTFWTFQEYANGFTDFGVQITQLEFVPAVAGGTANDGIHVDVRETARMTDSMINDNSIIGHGDDGIEVLVTDTAIVDELMINGNEISENGDDGITFETASPNQLGALIISGNSNVSDNMGDGIAVSINDLNPAMVPDVLVEANLVDGNMGDGIRVDIIDSSVDDVSVSLNTVRNNGGDGIFLNIDNMTGGVINADAVMLSSNMVEQNGGDGLVTVLNNLTGLRSVDMRMSTVASNFGRGVVFDIDNSPIENFNISDNTILNNAQADALLVDVTDSPIDVFTILRNQIGGAADDAVDLRLDGSPVGDLRINNNSMGMVMGMNTGTPIDDSLPVIRPGFDVNNLPANDDGSTGAVPIGFTIDFFGQNFAQTFVNNNGNITFTGPLFTFTPFDLLSTNTPIIAPFFADVDTRAGNIVTYGPGNVAGQTAFGVNWPAVRHFSVNDPGMGLPENIFQLVLVDRSDIAVGDFDVEFNYEQILWEAGTASGSDNMGLGGFSARAGLSNGVDFALELAGSAVNGAFLDSGPGATSLVQNSLNSANDGRYVFFFRGGALGQSAPSGGTGLEITMINGSDIGALEISGNTIDGNGTHGVDITVQDSTLPTAQASIVSDNAITNHTNGDGFRLINPDTNDTPFAIDFTGNTIGENGGVGLNIELNADSGGLTTTLTGNDISDNGSIGASFVLNDDANLDLTFGDSMQDANTLTANTDAGIAVKTKDMSTATIIVENTMVNATVDGPNAAFNGDGLAVHSSGNSLVSSMTVGDDVLQNTSFTGNEGNGIDIELSENASNPNILIQNVVANNNGAHGIGITRTGFSTFSEDLDSDGILDPGEDVNNDGMLGNAVITMTSANGNTGNGLDVSVSGAQQPVQQIDVMLNQNSFSNNTIGMNYTVSNDAMLLVNAANNIVNENSSHGIQVTTNQNAAFGNVLPSMGNPNSPLAIPSTFSSNVITNNGGNGLNFVANDSSVQVIDVDDAGAVNPSTGTARTVIDGNAGNQVQITGNDNSRQNIELEAVNITNINNVATGNGVDIDANDSSTVTVEISGGVTGPAVIGASVAHVSVPGLGGPGGGVADGIAADVSGQAILNLDVTNVTLFNNTGDGINIRNNGPGAATTGVAQRQTIQATFDDVDARLNGDQGFDVVLDGNIGGRAAQLDADVPVLIDIMNSNFSSNTNEGIFFRADPGFTHGGNQLYSDMVVTFNVIDSMIQSNGSASITDGLVMEIGTNAYVLSSIIDNVFGANGADDFHTNSFDSSILNMNAATLDLAFQGNSGDHIRPSAFGATIGNPFFVLDNSLTVEANNNFQLFGVPQMEVFGPDGFSTNGYDLRVISNHGSATYPPIP